MALKRLTLTRGDTQTYTLTFKQADGTLYCLKNWVVFFTLKTNYALADNQAVLQKIVTTFSDTTSGTSGVAVISLSPADTINLDPMEYDFDISVLTAASESFTVLKGKFDLQYDVTRSTGTAGTAA
jgi:hypothetical protein